jgi:hypothetical protein
MNKIASFRMFLAGFVCMLLSAFVVPAHAAEREVYRYSFQGYTIHADINTYDGCAATSMNISAVDGRTRSDGRPVRSSTVSGWIWQYNYCDGSYAAGYFATELDDDALQIDRQLQSATLNTTIQACDYWCFPVTLQLTWTGMGDSYREKSHFQSTSPYYKTISRYDGELRQSTVSGSISTPWGMTNVSSSSGSLQSLKSGSTSIYKLS